jgi:sterol desaturase/sphingolipid hydroxylase (fatty acid hydroxylase superfamily)
MQELITRYPGLLIAMASLALAELIWVRLFARRSYDVRASAASIGVAVGQALIKPLTAGLIAGTYGWIHSFALWHVPLDDWRAWVAGLFAVEFAYYWFHRWSHTVNWLWATHAVHHSANELTLPAAIRLGWTGIISGGWLIFAPLALLGMPPVMIGALLAANLLYQFGLHTEAVRKLGPLEWIFNTPSHHRAHHASEGQWLDCNFGGVLIVFDRWFGTFVAEPDEGGLRYGLTDPIRSHNPVVIALRQWSIMATAFSTAQGWQQRWQVLFGKPGAQMKQSAGDFSGRALNQCADDLQIGLEPRNRSGRYVTGGKGNHSWFISI